MTGTSGDDLEAGSSRRHAVVVRNVEEEYVWLREHFPGYRVTLQTLCLDADGRVTAANQTARQMVSQLNQPGGSVHCSELFAMPWEALFDGARHDAVVEVPLWSGLRLNALPQAPGQALPPVPRATPATPRPLPLKDLETELIRKAVQDARGNVMQAARALGISRATVYRKLGTLRG